MSVSLDPSSLPQARRVVLVRHARPRIAIARPSREWPLHPEGTEAAARLTALGLFEHVTGLYAGPEPKMAATLAPVAAQRHLTVQIEADLSESAVGGWLDGAFFLATVGRFFGVPDQPAALGWETSAAAAARFASAVERLSVQYGPVVRPGHVNPGTFAIVSGGRVLTAYLASALGYTSEDAFQVWRRLRMPDIAVLEITPDVRPRLVIPFGILAASPASLESLAG